MSDVPSLEDIISGAARGGWEWFDGIDSRIKQLVQVRQAEKGQKAKRIATAWAGFAASPAGREAIDELMNSTLRRTVFFVQLGEDVNPHNKWGYFREGQNAVAHEIARQIAAGRDVEKPKPRDT